MNQKRKHGTRIGGSILSAGWIGTVAQQFIAGPSEKAKEVLEAIIEPQAIYTGLIIIGVGGFLYFSWPYIIWCFTFRERRRRKRALLLRNQTNQAQSLILDFIQDSKAHILRNLGTPDEWQHHEGTVLGADIAIALRKLEALGFPRPKDISGEDWATMLKQVYRYLEEYGIEEARCVMAQLIEDHKKGKVRKVSEKFRLR